MLDKSILKKIPKEVGVYIFYNKYDEIIYVGKAKNLRNRISNHLNGKYWKSNLIVSEAERIDFTIVKNELEALLLEAKLIKTYYPKYNVQFKDDKSYPFIGISNDEYPFVRLVRNPQRSKFKFLFGPLSYVSLAKAIVEIISEQFKLRRCFNLRKNKCLYYDIGLCPAPCIKKVNKDEYSENVEKAIAFLKGKSNDYYQKLEKEYEIRLNEVIKNWDFKTAQELKDKIEAIKLLKDSINLNGRSDVVLSTLLEEKYLIIGLYVYNWGKFIYKKEEIIEIEEFEDKNFVINALLQIYEEYGLPDNLYVKDGVLFKLRGSNINVFAFNKLPERIKDVVEKNFTIFLENKAYSFIEKLKKEKQALVELKEALNLETLPFRIECFDISTLYGFTNTASCVVAVNGRLEKDFYRRYKLPTGKIDDFLFINHVLKKRYSKYPIPDLIVVDGGKGQVSSARKALEELGIEKYNLIGLVKGEEKIITVDFEEIKLPFSNLGLQLLVKLRDEAHRFAITYNRSLNENKILTEYLLKVKGLGKKRLKKLLLKFNDIESLKKATIEDIKSVGIPQKVAENIKKVLSFM